MEQNSEKRNEDLFFYILTKKKSNFVIETKNLKIIELLFLKNKKKFRISHNQIIVCTKRLHFT